MYRTLQQLSSSKIKFKAESFISNQFNYIPICCLFYNKVSGSKIWQMERSCMCCQESGEREASVSLFCPKAKQGEKKFRKVL